MCVILFHLTQWIKFFNQRRALTRNWDIEESRWFNWRSTCRSCRFPAHSVNSIQSEHGTTCKVSKMADEYDVWAYLTAKQFVFTLHAVVRLTDEWVSASDSYDSAAVVIFVGVGSASFRYLCYSGCWWIRRRSQRWCLLLISAWNKNRFQKFFFLKFGWMTV